MDTNSTSSTIPEGEASNRVKPEMNKNFKENRYRYNLVMPKPLYYSLLTLIQPIGITFAHACRMALTLLIMVLRDKAKIVNTETNEEIRIIW